MPPELAEAERARAFAFSEAFAGLHERINTAGPLERGDLGRFTAEVVEEIKPFIEYKATMSRLAALLRPSPPRSRAVDPTARTARRW